MTDDVRIIVFVCACGKNIGGIVNVNEVAEFAKKLPNVVHAETTESACSEEFCNIILQRYNEFKFNRVVLASCACCFLDMVCFSGCGCRVKCNEEVFFKKLQLNKYLFEFINIRELCSWVHKKEPESATKKVKELIKMGVARIALLEPQEDIEVKVEPSITVIGAGISGVTAALNIARRGYKVYLIEKQKSIGGMLNFQFKLYPTDKSSQEILSSFSAQIKNQQNIELLTSTELRSVRGSFGDFEITVFQNDQQQERTFKTGTIILATGADEFKPVSMYGYGEHKNIMTLLELETHLKNGTLETPKNVIIISCVGALGEKVTYCSRICCAMGIKNAIYIKELYPDISINILNKEIRVYGVRFEQLYKKALDMGISFEEYSTDKLPNVEKIENNFKVKFNDKNNIDKIYEADLIILSTPLISPSGAKKLSDILGVPLGIDGFFSEEHINRRPLDFAIAGIYLCGTARGPASIRESIAQALGAASRATIPLMKGTLKKDRIIAMVNERTCRGCGKCVEICPYNAIELKEVNLGRFNAKVAKINEVLCRGCGTCTLACCNGSISIGFFKNEHINSMVDALFKPEYEVIS